MIVYLKLTVYGNVIVKLPVYGSFTGRKSFRETYSDMTYVGITARFMEIHNNKLSYYYRGLWFYSHTLDRGWILVVVSFCIDECLTMHRITCLLKKTSHFSNCIDQSIYDLSLKATRIVKCLCLSCWSRDLLLFSLLFWRSNGWKTGCICFWLNLRFLIC